MAELLPYTAVSDAQGEIAWRPLLQLTLHSDRKWVEANSLLDTGADVNVLPYQVGIALGIVWDQQTPLTPPSGNLRQYETRGIVLDATVGQLAPVRLAFAWTRSENVPLILGQENFFATFDVYFFRGRALFEIQPKQTR